MLTTMKGEIDSNTIIVGEYNTPFTPTDRSSKQKINNETQALNDTRDKEGHYIMMKGSIQEEDITIINIYAPNIGAPQYIRQLLTALKEEIDSNTK